MDLPYHNSYPYSQDWPITSTSDHFPLYSSQSHTTPCYNITTCPPHTPPAPVPAPPQPPPPPPSSSSYYDYYTPSNCYPSASNTYSTHYNTYSSFHQHQTNSIVPLPHTNNSSKPSE